jgi:5-methylcytosine-specific restriction endonuclease McrA
MARTGRLCECGQCRRYKKLSAQFRAHCARHDAPCWLCLDPIDYTLDYTHPESFSLDHRAPRSLSPELTEDPGNFMPSHSVCNKRRGNRGPINVGMTSRRW